MDTRPTTRYTLTKKQHAILKLIYRFRFTTSELLSQSLNISKTTINKRLQLMTELKYIERRFNARDKLLGKHATYFLTSQGFKAFKQSPLTSGALARRNSRNDSKVSDQYIDYHLGVFETYCRLRSLYGERLHFVSKNQLTDKYDYFSEFLPGAYVRLDIDGRQKDFFLEYLQSGKPFFATMKRLKEYIEYADSGEWEAGTESSFPAILLVCDSPVLQERLQKRGLFVLDEADDDLKLYMSSSVSVDAWTDFRLANKTLHLSSI